jgi:protein involved in polysaccharide export with SLBB domain
MAFGDELKITDALQLARGLIPTSSDIAYVRRKDWYNPDTYQYIKIDLKDTNVWNLRAGDHLMIYDKSVYSVASNISISGSIQKPQNFPYSTDLKLKDVFMMSGGKKISADLSRVEIFRLTYNKKRGSGYERIELKLDTNYNVIGKNARFDLLPFDQIIVRDLSQYNTNKRVEIAGEVHYPGTYPLPAKPFQLSDLVDAAGGLNAFASKHMCVLFRDANDIGPIGVDLRKAMRRKNSKRFNPVLMTGDLVSILPAQYTFSIRLEGTQYPQIEKVAKTHMTFVYQGKKSARWYIREFAGGFHPEADKQSVAVAYPTGQVTGTKRVLGIFKNYPTVMNGGEIVLVNKVKEDKTKEKKEIDYDAIFTRSFQAVSSLLTITLLIKQL